MRLLRRSAAPPVPPNADAARWALVETVKDGRPLWVRRNLDWAVFRRIPGRA